MLKKNIFVTQPSLPPIEEFIPYIEKIWSNKILTNGGEFHTQLEEELCEYLKVEFISLFNNGTIALITALKALNLSGEVITTPYSFVATSHALSWMGIKPVFVDIDPVTLNIDPKKVERAITPNTSAILGVHCYGTPCNVEEIQAIASRNNLKVVYDAAHAFGINYKGKSLLQFGNLSILSFHATKVFNTFEGGAIVSHDIETKRKIDNLKNFGFENETTVNEVGINGKMSEINAAMGLLQLKYVNEAISDRERIYQQYTSKVKNIPGIECLKECNFSNQNYSYFPILINENYSLSRDELYEKLKSHGVYSRRYFYPLISDFPMYKLGTQVLDVAVSVSRRVLCLPIYAALTTAETDHIIDLIATP